MASLKSTVQFIYYNKMTISFLLLGFFGIMATSPILTNVKLQKQDTYIIPPKEMVYFSFGFQEAFASLMWLRLLQDIDICEQGHQVSYNPGTSVDSILESQMPDSRCNEGWVFHMLDRITDFSPRFLYAYVHGGVLLSIIVDDRQGARQIFEKGLKVFPNHYNLNYNAAYHYLVEIRDPKRAAQLMQKTQELGGPSWLSLLAARLYAKGGMKEAGIYLLNQLIEESSDPQFIEAAQERLKQIILEE